MEHYAGLDVSLDLTSICIVDPEDRIIGETKVATDPGAIVTALNTLGIKWQPSQSSTSGGSS